MRRTVLKDHPRVPTPPPVPFPAMFSRSKKAQQTNPTRTPLERDPNRLPKGAGAALWSIVEATPDPRNYLALTRDPTAEVRISRHDIDAAMAAAEPLVPWVPPAGVVVAPEAFEAENRSELVGFVPPAAGAETPMPKAAAPRNEGIRWSADTAEVRLPARGGPYDGDAEDGSVHPLETDKNKVDPARYARGA